MPTGGIIIGKSNFSINEEGNEWLWASSELYNHMYTRIDHLQDVHYIIINCLS